MTVVVAHLIRPQPRGSVGGADLHIVDLCREQQKGGEIEPYVIELGDTGYSDLVRRQGVPAVAMPAAFRPARLARLATALADAEIIHSHGYESDYVGAVARTMLRSRPRLVTTTHGFVRTSPILRAKTRLDEACLRRADALIACSQDEQARLGTRYGDLVFYVPNGVPGCTASTGQRRPSLTAGSVTLGFVGRLSPEKRPDLAIRLLATLAARPIASYLRFFGAGPERAQLGALARRHHVDDRVSFEGLQRDIDAIYAAIDVLVCLSDTEGTPRVVLEAMARKVPVVASSVGGVPQLLGEGAGMLVEPGDVDGATEAVALLLADPAVADSVTEAAYEQWRSSFTAERMAEGVANVYRAISPRSFRARCNSTATYWEAVGSRLNRSSDDSLLAGDQSPFYRAKNAPIVRRIEELLADSHHRWLEVGCGLGRNLRLRAGGLPIVGVDASASMLAGATRAAPTALLLNADGRQLPFRTQAFGAALTVTVLQHVDDHSLRRLVRELCRVADEVHIFEDVALLRVRDRASHWLRPPGMYRLMFASHGFRLARFERYQMPISESMSVVARRVLNPAARAEGQAVSPLHEACERTLLPVTTRLDRLAPPVVGLVAMTFVREQVAQAGGRPPA